MKTSAGKSWTGDRGMTSMLSGRRVRKDHPVVAALGDLDELQSFLGAAVAFLPRARRFGPLKAGLRRIQEDLFNVGSLVAGSSGTPGGRARAAALAAALERLHRETAEADRRWRPAGFVLPGGPPPAAFLHLARSVSRRAERSVVAAARLPAAGAYLNRLAGFLFAAAVRLSTSRA
ncbi:MAG: cob(I)yrinic acid a,c-diamide adenosyltransferase [Elusimicrobiota bacterium]|jgi:cob(I)alamin adenosyltransferase